VKEVMVLDVRGSERWQRTRYDFQSRVAEESVYAGCGTVCQCIRLPSSQFDAFSVFLESISGSVGRVSGEVGDLLKPFETELSPRRLVERLPLANCSPQVAGWLPWLIHELWLSGEPVCQRTLEGVGNLTDADTAYSAIMKELDRVGSAPSMDDLRRMRSLFPEFREHYPAVGSAVSSFPARIKAA